MYLVDRSGVHDAALPEQARQADASTRFLHALSLCGIPLPLAAIKAGCDLVELASLARGRTVALRSQQGGLSLTIVTPVGPCAPAV